KIQSVVAATDIAAFLPGAKRGDASNQTEIPQFLQCTDVYFPKIEANLGMQVVTSMNTDGSNVAASAAVNNSWLTYVSSTHLYMAESSNNWFWDQANIDQTAIHKFSISENKPQYLATGSVDGYANSAFNFSEHNDVLRVATTQTVYEKIDDSTMGFWQPIFKNHLTLLKDDNNGKMNTISEIRDIAVGETIRGVRFLADRGFIVTFRNVDPLFTFDLSDPNNPLLKGELKIPGFSSYLHPYGDNHLLTVGREGGAGDVGLGNDVQLQLIDVSDLSKPKVIHKYTPDLPQGYSWSAAQYDHHAFTYYEPENLLAMPIQISPNASSISPFSGVIAFKVTLDNGFEELGRVDHADLAEQYYCVDNTVIDPLIGYCSSGYYGDWATPRRSVVMTSGPSVYLYTISDVGLKANEVNDFNTTLGSLLFPPQIYPWDVGGVGVDNNGSGGPVTITPANITNTL
ncbi:MAG: hypothetical protein GXP19_08600, partial [Gammaproteobacteria bacterium]|nr:hypothetical protein [Gammaproteobacteria bacterium]